MSKIVPFVVGGAVGTLAALLYAPRTGSQMRSLVVEKVNALWGEAKDWGSSATSGAQEAYKAAQEKGTSVFNDVASNAQDFAKNAVSQAGEMFSSASSRVKEAAPQAAPAYSGDGDDLREKIEAARQRIAAQVMQNAEAAAEAAPVEAAVDAAEEVAEAVEGAAEAVADAVEEIAEKAE